MQGRNFSRGMTCTPLTCNLYSQSDTIEIVTPDLFSFIITEDGKNITDELGNQLITEPTI